MSTPFIGKREYFPDIGQIKFEGQGSDNPLAFKVYDAARRVGGKTMAEHLRFAVCYWHNLHQCRTRSLRSRHAPLSVGCRFAMATAEARVDAAFEVLHQDRRALLLLP